MALCADGNLRNRSSVVIDVAPRLPQHPALEGKYLQPYYSPFRFPGRPDRVNASKVSPSAFSRSTDVSRYCFDAAAATDGSVDPTAMFRSVSEWLRESGMSQVSPFVFLRYFGTDTLDLDVYRSNLHPATLPSTFDVSVRTFRSVCGLLHDSCASQVSCFIVLHRLVADALSFELSRFNLHSIGSTAGSNDPQATFQVVSAWLCATHAFKVSRFGFMALADFSRFEFDSSTSTETSNESVRML